MQDADARTELTFCRILDPSCPSWVSSSFAVLLPVSSCPGEGATHSTLSVGKTMVPLLHVAMVVYPEHPASKVISAFLCLGALKQSTARSCFFPRQYGTIGWQRLLIGCSRSTRQPPALYQPPTWGLLRITHLATYEQAHGIETFISLFLGDDSYTLLQPWNMGFP